MSICPNDCTAGVVPCWSPGGPCPPGRDICECCGPCADCRPGEHPLLDLPADRAPERGQA